MLQLISQDLRIVLKDTFRFCVYYLALGLFASLVIYAMVYIQLESQKLDYNDITQPLENDEVDYIVMFENYMLALSISRHFVFILCVFIIFFKDPLKTMKQTVVTAILIFVCFLIATIELPIDWFRISYQFIAVISLSLVASWSALRFKKIQITP